MAPMPVKSPKELVPSPTVQHQRPLTRRSRDGGVAEPKAAKATGSSNSRGYMSPLADVGLVRGRNGYMPEGAELRFSSCMANVPRVEKPTPVSVCRTPVSPPNRVLVGSSYRADSKRSTLSSRVVHLNCRTVAPESAGSQSKYIDELFPSRMPSGPWKR